MARRHDSGEIVKRALAYPHAVPGRSFVQLGERTERLSDVDPADLVGELERRAPLLAYGANAAPAALARKLATLPGVPLPVLGAELAGFDVVYSAHVSPRGSVPGTLWASAGTSVRVAVLLATAEQRDLLSATEPNYELGRLPVELRPDAEAAALLPAEIAEIDAYASRHGCLEIDASPVALAEVAADGRRLPSLRQPEVLERVRAQLRPDLGLEEFVLQAVAAGGVAPIPGFGPR